MMVYIGLWIVVLLAAMPVAFTLGFVGYVFLWAEGGSMISTPQRLFAALDSVPLLAVPAFILAGEIMNRAGITTRLFNLASRLVGHLTGSLGHVSIVTNVIVAAMSGSALASAAGVGSLMIENMKREGWHPGFAGAVNAAASTLGPLIPPSIIFVVYAVMANASVGRLLIAGIVPGLLTAAVLMIHVWLVARRHGYKTHPRASLRELWAAFRKAFFALLTPVIIVGGIIGGIMTATEAAAATSVYALFLGLVVYRSLSWSELPDIFINAALTSAIIGFIIATANLTSFILTRQRIPQQITELLLSVSSDPMVILTLICLLIIVLGCFMEGMALLLLTMPMLLPVTRSVGIDPVHFGVVVVLCLGIGLLTPPFGMTLFVVSRVGDIPFTQLARSIIPFILVLITVVLMCFSEALVLFLPNLLFGS